MHVIRGSRRRAPAGLGARVPVLGLVPVPGITAVAFVAGDALHPR